MADINFYSGIDITGNISLSGSFSDTAGSSGSNGFILSSTTTGTSWINPNTLDNIANTDLTLTANRILYFGAAGLANRTLEFLDNVNTSVRIIKFTDADIEMAKEVHLKSASATAVPLHFHGPSSSAFSVSLQAPSLLASTAYTLPDADGTNKQVIITNGSAELSWSDAENIGNNNLSIPGTSTARTLTLSSGSNASFTIESDGNDPYIECKKSITDIYKKLRIKPDSTDGGIIQIYEGTGASDGYVGFQAGHITSSIDYTLPVGPPASDKVLQSTSLGVMSWVDAGGADTNIANTDLTLDATRTLDLDGNSLSFSSNDGGSTDTIASWSYTTMQVFGDFYLRTNSSTIAPTMRFSAGTSSNFVALKAPDTVGTSYTLTLPDADGTDGQVIQTDGSGEMSWVDNTNIGSANLTIDGTSTARTLTLSSGNASSFVIESNGNDPYIQFKKGVTTAYKRLEIQDDSANGGEFRIYEGNAGSGKYVGFQAPDLVTTTANYTLPVSAPASDMVLQSTSAGVMSWVAGGGTDTNIGDDDLVISDAARTLTLNSAAQSTFSILDTSGDTIAEFTDGSNKFVDPVSIQNVAGTVGSLFIFDQDNTNYIGFDVPFNTTSSILYTLPEPPTTNGQILASQTDGTMSWEDSSPTPTLVMGGGGRVAISTTIANNARFAVCGGTLGFNYYSWSTAMYNGTPDFTGLGVPGTSTSIVTPYLGNQGAFKVVREGEISIQGTVEGSNNSEVYDEDVFIYVFKVPSAIVTAMGNGGAQDNTAYELVASAKCTMPSSNASSRPQSFVSTNGETLDKDDWVFAAMAFDAAVTSTRYFYVNFNVYT
jgi:hypothetical protein